MPISDGALAKREITLGFMLAGLMALSGLGSFFLADIRSDVKDYKDRAYRDLEIHDAKPFHGQVGLDLVDMKRQLIEIQKGVDRNSNLIEDLRRNRIQFSPLPDEKSFP